MKCFIGEEFIQDGTMFCIGKPTYPFLQCGECALFDEDSTDCEFFNKKYLNGDCEGKIYIKLI